MAFGARSVDVPEVDARSVEPHPDGLAARQLEPQLESIPRRPAVHEPSRGGRVLAIIARRLHAARGDEMGGVRVCALALAVAALAAGCGGPEKNKKEGELQPGPTGADPGSEATLGPPVRGDWLVLHFLADPENLNPLTSN